MKSYLVVGLGNPGKRYEKTRHNIGFEVIDAIANEQLLSFSTGRYSQYADFSLGDNRVYLIKPMTYMNESGQAVREWVKKKGILLEHVLVVHDELHLPVGKLRVRPGGGSGGHNGIKSITALLGSSDYPRLRIGIGKNFSEGDQGDYVLAPFLKAEHSVISSIIELARKASINFISEGIEKTMQSYN